MKLSSIIAVLLFCFIIMTFSSASDKLEELPQDTKELYWSLQADGYLDENYLPVTKEAYYKLREVGLLGEDLNIEAAFMQKQAADLLRQTGTSESEEKLMRVIEKLNTVLEIDPDYAPAYYTLSWAYLHLSRLSVEDKQRYQEKALSAKEQAVILRPDWNFILVRIPEEINSDRTMKRLEEQREINREKIRKYYGYLDAGIQSEEYAEKVTYFHKALEVDPENYTVYSFLASAHYDNQHYKEAIAAWQKKLEIDPELNVTRIRLVMAHIKLGEVDDAIRECEKILQFDPEHRMAQEMLEKLRSE